MSILTKKHLKGRKSEEFLAELRGERTKKQVFKTIWNYWIQAIKNGNIEKDLEICQKSHPLSLRALTNIISKQVATLVNDEKGILEIRDRQEFRKYLSGRKDTKTRIIGILTASITDILILFYIHKNLWISASECKRFLSNSMKDKKSLEEIHMAISEVEYNKEKLYKLIWKLNSATIKKESDCSFSDTWVGNGWINDIWNLIEHKIAPSIQMNFWNKSSLTKEELFYLGRYNEIKK